MQRSRNLFPLRGTIGLRRNRNCGRDGAYLGSQLELSSRPTPIYQLVGWLRLGSVRISSHLSRWVRFFLFHYKFDFVVLAGHIERGLTYVCTYCGAIQHNDRVITVPRQRDRYRSTISQDRQIKNIINQIPNKRRKEQTFRPRLVYTIAVKFRRSHREQRPKAGRTTSKASRLLINAVDSRPEEKLLDDTSRNIISCSNDKRYEVSFLPIPYTYILGTFITDFNCNGI